MDVRPGYKQTEVGVIPEEWKVVLLGDLAEFVTSGSRGWAAFYADSGALFIRSQNVRDGRLSLEDTQHVRPPSGAEGNRTRVARNDLLITITGNSVGNVALVEREFEEAYISQHVGMVRLHDAGLGAYVCRYLSPNSPGNPQISGSQSGQSKPGLNLQNLRDFKIAVPPSGPEQCAIAAALSDVDALLDGLDRLIAKKRNLKQAAMQQLLTGQIRLPGFSSPWTETRLGDVGSFTKGSSVKKSEANSGSLPCVRYGELYTHHQNVIREFYSSISAQVASTAMRLQQGDVLFAGSGETKEEIGKCAAFTSNAEAYAGGDIVILRGHSQQPTFMGYYLNSPAVVAQKASRGQGDAVVHISARALGDIVVRLPVVDEQTAIARVLSDMDAELAALEARRDKTRNINKAMMHELLTGKTRLVNGGARV